MKAVLKPRIHLDDRTPLETVIPLSTLYSECRSGQCLQLPVHLLPHRRP
jgi:hypothetical protein